MRIAVIAVLFTILLCLNIYSGLPLTESNDAPDDII
jgi:hypothetical protein